MQCSALIPSKLHFRWQLGMPVEHPYEDGVRRRKRRACAVEPKRETNRVSRQSPELAPISVVMSVVTVYISVS